MENEIRKWWSPFICLNWKFGLFLVLIICVTRFLLVLQANQSGVYNLIGLIMFASALLPFLFLNRKGIKSIGIRKTSRWGVLIFGVTAGIAFSILLYFAGVELYGDTFQNWYVYIGKSYNIPPEISAADKRIMFFIIALVGITFSPVGEEFFFRGIVHESFARSFGDQTASLLDSAAFAITHLAHFGIVFVHDQWDFYWWPSLVWVFSMFMVSILFFQMKKLSNSIWGAVLCHAGFNLGMIYCIFYWL